MRWVVFLGILIGSIHPALAVDIGSTPPSKPLPADTYQGGGRTGGDTVGDAVLIPDPLPFADTGNTCGFANDYDEICPYTGSTSPDVVYSYTPGNDEAITVDLCASQYDTKVYIYAGAPGNLVACNDDAGCGYSGWQSRIENAALSAGTTYYIVVDGYGSDCGDYDIQVMGFEPCVLACPPGALKEGEPPCQDGYEDYYNSGCGGPGYNFQPIEPQAGGCATMCGKSCTYLVSGLSYRDTDWFAVTAAGGPLSADCTAEFQLQFLLIYNADCSNLWYELVTAPPCVPAHLEHVCQPGQEVWVWVGSWVFSGLPESDYILEICGIQQYQTLLGACCFGVQCWVTYEEQCAGLWLGPGTDCNPDPCSMQDGACCFPDGSCQMLTGTQCLEASGDWLGAGQTCDPNPCPPPVPTEQATWGKLKYHYR